MIVYSHDHAAMETPVTSTQVAKASIERNETWRRYLGWGGG
jgi:hypothetical protein